MGEPGNINNYKGVMLCSRPNEGIQIIREKPFCSRVEVHEPLGLNPIKKENEFVASPVKKRNPVLQRHKDWLEIYKLKMKFKKEEQQDSFKRAEEKFEKIKEIAAKDRDQTRIMKKQFEKLNRSIMQELDQEAGNNSATTKQMPLTEQNLKALDENTRNGGNPNDSSMIQPQSTAQQTKKQKEKPQWAYTQEQIKQKQENQCDDLLNFVNNLDYQKYVNDLEVQSMLKSIQNRISEIKQKENWREEAQQRFQKEKEDREANKEDHQDNNDYRSLFSNNDEKKSVASERSFQSIQSLQSKLEEKKQGLQSEWDKATTNNNPAVNLEERIAKNVADEVLRNYQHLSGVHSNQSIRKLLQKEAKNHLNKQDTIDGPVISIVQENTMRRGEIDPNNLPYLHRNPAI